jgi:methanogenic corrinoid protein MtbC1
MSNEVKYPIKAVVNKTGLSSHVIRIWERRYHAVTPERTATNRRLYSETDVERLAHLQNAVSAGHAIGQIARLPIEKLRQLTQLSARDRAMNTESLSQGEVLAAAQAARIPQRRNANEEPAPQDFVESSIAAVRRFDTVLLEATLTRANLALGALQMIERVIVPFINRIGEMWHEGTMRVMHEHLATSVIRTFCTNLKSMQDLPAAAPTIVVTTPAGQVHELGALIVALLARHQGWNTVYLGPNLPAEEIAAAADASQARAVALSIVYPADDPALAQELQKLRNYLRAEVRLIVGGRAKEGYARTLEAVGAIQLSDITGLRNTLDAMRRPSL